MSKTSVRRLVKQAAEVANVCPYVAGAGRGEPSEVSPHPFRYSIAFWMIRQEDKRLEDVLRRLRHSQFKRPIRFTAIYGVAKNSSIVLGSHGAQKQQSGV
ncbi:hypothetical protein [Halalkalicoccus salilacus]|uniref:hypothetical protein n=1 Tax=Halalkalicoccus salilacus TaxID=3117459 RepID=UPI00300EA342